MGVLGSHRGTVESWAGLISPAELEPNTDNCTQVRNGGSQDPSGVWGGPLGVFWGTSGVWGVPWGVLGTYGGTAKCWRAHLPQRPGAQD